MACRLKNFTLLLILLFFACKPQGVIHEGRPVPDFSLKGLNGEVIKLSNLKGKVVLIEFWATWCEACREAVPDMIEIYKNNRNKEFEMIAVSVDEGNEVSKIVEEFKSQYNITYPIALNGLAISKKFGVYTIPSIFIIDKTGILVKRYPGYFPDMVSRIDRDIKGLL